MEIITPIKKNKIELKDWITGGELQEINRPMSDIKMQMEIGGKTMAEINIGEATRKMIEKAIEVIVVSVDGDNKDILGKVYGLHSKDFEMVKQKIDDIIKGEDFQKAE